MNEAYWKERLRVNEEEIAFILRCLRRAKERAKVFKKNLEETDDE